MSGKKKPEKQKPGDEKPKRGRGRPSEYRPEFCQLLVQHMAEGGSFASFAATIGKSWEVLYVWCEAHEEFLEAKAEGEAKGLLWWENVGKATATGNLRRVESEEFARDEQGRVIFENGKPVVARRTYAPAKGDSKIWSVTMRNRFRRFYDEEITLKIKRGPKDPSEMTDAELDEALEETRRRRK
jgi:hypothetical protein